MSLRSIQSSINSTQSQIQSLQRRLTDKARDMASKSHRLAELKSSLARSSSASQVQSRLRQIDGLERDIARIQRDRADLEKQVGEKTGRLHTYQNDLYKEQQREQAKLQSTIERLQSEEAVRRQSVLADVAQEIGVSSMLTTPEYDAFISHASEDKDGIVRPLAEALTERGLSIWYDEFQLSVGDSLRRSIDKGLACSRFGIVVLSPSFFAKDWTQYELDGLVSKEVAANAGKVILPLWHKVSKDEVMKYSPSLADKLALNTAVYTVDELAERLASAMQR